MNETPNGTNDVAKLNELLLMWRERAYLAEKTLSCASGFSLNEVVKILQTEGPTILVPISKGIMVGLTKEQQERAWKKADKANMTLTGWVNKIVRTEVDK